MLMRNGRCSYPGALPRRQPGFAPAPVGADVATGGAAVRPSLFLNKSAAEGVLRLKGASDREAHAPAACCRGGGGGGGGGGDRAAVCELCVPLPRRPQRPGHRACSDSTGPGGGVDVRRAGGAEAAGGEGRAGRGGRFGRGRRRPPRPPLLAVRIRPRGHLPRRVAPVRIGRRAGDALRHHQIPRIRAPREPQALVGPTGGGRRRCGCPRPPRGGPRGEDRSHGCGDDGARGGGGHDRPRPRAPRLLAFRGTPEGRAAVHAVDGRFWHRHRARGLSRQADARGGRGRGRGAAGGGGRAPELQVRQDHEGPPPPEARHALRVFQAPGLRLHRVHPQDHPIRGRTQGHVRAQRLTRTGRDVQSARLRQEAAQAGRVRVPPGRSGSRQRHLGTLRRPPAVKERGLHGAVCESSTAPLWSAENLIELASAGMKTQSNGIDVCIETQKQKKEVPRWRASARGEREPFPLGRHSWAGPGTIVVI